MDTIALLSGAAGLAWVSGFRLYLVLFLAGLLGRLEFVPLPAGLDLLTHDWVLAASGVMSVVEFLADKVPMVDSAWDAVHTFIRIPAGGILAAAALGFDNPALTLAAAIVGGAIASGAHLTKAGTRALINTSPEPFSNWGASIAEDGMALGGLWAALAVPLVFLGLLAVFLVVAILFVPRLFRAMRAVLGRLRGAGTAP